MAKPRPKKNMILPGGAEIRLEAPKVKKLENGKRRAIVWVAVKHGGGPQKIEQRAAKYARKVLWDFGYLVVGGVKNAAWLPVPTMFGPMPYAQGRWAPVKVIAEVKDDPDY